MWIQQVLKNIYQWNESLISFPLLQHSFLPPPHPQTKSKPMLLSRNRIWLGGENDAICENKDGASLKNTLQLYLVGHNHQQAQQWFVMVIHVLMLKKLETEECANSLEGRFYSKRRQQKCPWSKGETWDMGASLLWPVHYLQTYEDQSCTYRLLVISLRLSSPCGAWVLPHMFMVPMQGLTDHQSLWWAEFYLP